MQALFKRALKIYVLTHTLALTADTIFGVWALCNTSDYLCINPFGGFWREIGEICSHFEYQFTQLHLSTYFLYYVKSQNSPKSLILTHCVGKA